MSTDVPALDFMPTTVALLRRAVEKYADNDFIIEPDRRATYAEIDRLSRAFAKRLLLMGVSKGTRVAAKYPNGIQWAIAFLAVTRIGGFFMPLSSAYKIDETRKCLRIGDAEFLLLPESIVGRNQRAAAEEMLERPLPVGEEALLTPMLPYLRHVLITGLGDVAAGSIDLGRPDPAWDERLPDALLAAVEAQVTPADWMLAIFTSGSTSDPKCVVHTHGGPIRHGTAIIELNGWTDNDRIFAGMPFFWVGGNCYTVVPAMMVGAAIVCVERFEAGAVLDLLEREQVTRVIGWPGIVNPLLEHPSLPARSIPGFDDPVWHPRVAWNTGLGMSETASSHTCVYVDDRAAAAGSVGRPIPFVDHRIVDEDTGLPVAAGEVGNIQVRGYSLMAGFYKREREDVFERDGFYDTHDRGYLKDGFLYFAGRDVGLIKTAGNNVSAAEVEMALKTLPGIAKAFVVGIEDAAVGQVVGAAIVPGDPAAIDFDAIRSLLGNVLSSYKIPRLFCVLGEEDIPYLANGKLDFRALATSIARSDTSSPSKQ